MSQKQVLRTALALTVCQTLCVYLTLTTTRGSKYFTTIISMLYTERVTNRPEVT